MNEIINKFLLVEDKYMPEMHLKQRGFTYCACALFTKTKKRIEKFMQTGNTNFIYRNELDKACFQHDMAYGKSKDLIKRTQSDKVLKDKAFKIANNSNYNGYQGGLASMVYKFFDKKSTSLINLKEVLLLMNQIINCQMNFMNQLLENSKKEKFIHNLKIVFGVLI